MKHKSVYGHKVLHREMIDDRETVITKRDDGWYQPWVYVNGDWYDLEAWSTKKEAKMMIKRDVRNHIEDLKSYGELKENKMIHVKKFNQFIKESLYDSPVNEGEGYFKGISKSTAAKKKSQMDKQAAMPDNDSAAYKELPGDTKGKKNIKTSKHTKKYHELYGEGALGIIEEKKEKKQSTDRSPIDSAKIEKALKTKAKESGAPIGIIRAVMRRGLAAWKTGHRPGATQQQWGYARTNSFLTGGEGTWGGADKDLAKEARAAGFKPKK